MDNKDLFDLAYAKGMYRGNNFKPTPMVVGMAANLTGNEIVPGTREVINEGVCGFAWVNIKPATSSFAKWLKSKDLARKSYYGGIDIWCREFNQSMERKEAWAEAFCEVLNEHGIKAYPMSRMD